jgi:four helix bundle protein
MGSAAELSFLLEACKGLGYLEEEKYLKNKKEVETVSKMFNALRTSIKKIL